MSYWLTLSTKFSANQLLLRTNQICQSFAVIVFKFKNRRLLHKSQKVQNLAFSRKNFFLNGMMRPDRVRRGGAHLTIHGEVKNSSGRKLFSVEVLISSETQDLCPCWLWFPANWTSLLPVAHQQLFLYSLYSEPTTLLALKPVSFCCFLFIWKTEYIYSKAFQVQNLLFSNHYAKMEKKWKLSFQAMNDSLCGIKWNR